MATLTVTTTADRFDAGDGVLFLREAVAWATDAAVTVRFAAALEGRALTLAHGRLTLTGGPADHARGDELTLDGVHHVRSRGHRKRRHGVGPLGLQPTSRRA